jgi:hypothetical protein
VFLGGGIEVYKLTSKTSMTSDFGLQITPLNWP